MSDVLGQNFIEQVGLTADRWSHEILRKAAKPIIDSADRVLASVARTFELRHIICHEFASAHEITVAEITVLFDDCGMFLRASREFISETLQPGAPLTQTDMNIAAAAKLGEAEQQLAEVLSSLGQPNLPERIECANARWLEFAEA
jgi:hypothetical protein